MKKNAFTFCIINIILVRVVPVDACDLDTQYEKDGVCCKMCGPGTRMSSQPSCEDPVCSPCGKDEYQSGYTRETKCQLQPFCDPNMNLEQKVQVTTTRVPCTCKSAHHCSSKECLTCVPNTACKAGEGASKIATQISDTICEACGGGTFSNESSAVEGCRTWTKCAEKTHKIKKSGTPTSDVECEERPSYVALAVSLFVILAVFAIIGVFILMKVKGKLKNCFKNSGGGDQLNPLEVGLLHVRPLEEVGPQNGVGHDQEGSTLPGRNPEENEEAHNPVQVKDMTDNNKPLRQEEGKTEHISQPESDEAEHSCFTDC
ncbi:hypothetical protein SKAU_G00098650 [Synaphobranchus kaupii]|uniref:TNFR-Cys domain-containing protein n=1 Tax=Synaphobranchus kaupii TaxID=118154 RepID=A0A9Q1FYC3_SYNKA|nr:hypothetical protein SKAU_G00098650 [Synaphobranchus kaupii]